MQITHSFDEADALVVGWGIRVLLLTGNPDGLAAKRLAGLGGTVETETEFYAAMSAMIDDPVGYGVFVMECDDIGGVEAGQRAQATLAAVKSRIPVILISAEYKTQVFPQGRDAAVCLRAPLSVVSLRVGFEHALRDRLMWHAA